MKQQLADLKQQNESCKTSIYPCLKWDLCTFLLQLQDNCVFGAKLRRKTGEKLRLVCKDFSGLLLCQATHGFEVEADKGYHLRVRAPPMMSIASEEEFIYLGSAAVLGEA